MAGGAGILKPGLWQAGLALRGHARSDRRRRRLGDAFAIPARKLLAHVLNDFPAPRLAFERFRHSLRELAQVRAAAFAAGARRWIDDALAWQIVRQLRRCYPLG